MKKLILLLSVFMPAFAMAAYELVWSDEFDCEELNTTAWSYEIGTGYQGWGNWESEYYTSSSDNSFIEDGKLVIRALKDETQYNPNYQTHFTSARIITKNKLQAKYGKIEARIKLPEAKKGVWPAFWMLGTSNNYSWPYCGETDIMEYMCTSANYKNVSSYIHWHNGSGQADYGKSVAINNPQEFHLYSVEWNSNEMIFRVDNTVIVTADINSVTAPTLTAFHSEFFIILNLAIGGAYVQYSYDPAITEETMYVDYVRVYQDKEAYPASSLTDKTDDCGAETDYCDMVKSWNKGSVYFAPNWSQTSNYTFEASERSASIHMGDATYDQWQAQFWCIPSTIVPTVNGEEYEVTFKVKATKNISRATLKMVQNGNDGIYLFLKEVALTANETYNFSYSGSAPDGLTDAVFVFDFGGNAANTDVTILDIKVRKASCETVADEAEAQVTSEIHKELRDGRIVIVRDGKVYNLMGVEIK